MSAFVLVARVECSDGEAVFYGFDHGNFPDSTIARIGAHRDSARASIFARRADAEFSAGRLNADGVIPAAWFVVEPAAAHLP